MLPSSYPLPVNFFILDASLTRTSVMTKQIFEVINPIPHHCVHWYYGTNRGEWT